MGEAKRKREVVLNGPCPCGRKTVARFCCFNGKDWHKPAATLGLKSLPRAVSVAKCYMKELESCSRRTDDRGDRGNVGIIRSPIRASILPDYIGSECEILYASRCFPLRLQTQTFLDAVGTSHLCQQQSFQQTTRYLRTRKVSRRLDPCRQLLRAAHCSFRACGLTHWGYSLVFFLDDDELNRGVSYVCKLMPWGRRHI